MFIVAYRILPPEPSIGWNYSEATAYCNSIGLRLANLTDAEKAWEEGMDCCGFGWMQGTQRITVMQSQKPGCGNINGVAKSTKDPSYVTSAYCSGHVGEYCVYNC